MLVDIPKIILASGSPRRKELMLMAGFNFEVRVKNTDETHPSNTLSKDCLLYTSPSPRDRQKSRMPSSA